MTRTPDAHPDRVPGVVRSLTRRHPRVAESTIEHWVTQVFDSYRSAPVQAYVPLLAEREVEARLREREGGGWEAEEPALDG
jgi:transposase-like protein